MSTIQIVPLGAGQDVGRSCILVSIGGKNIMFDCGMHMGYNDSRRFPQFNYISNTGNFDEVLDCIIISHFHLDHCGALPFFTEMCGYNGPIYMTYPTKAICPILLDDYRKITVERKGEIGFFTSQMIKTCMKKVIPVNLHQTIWVDDELEIKAYYAGHVLGAAMFYVRVNGVESVLYTGDYNMTPDRHLGAARVDSKIRPDVLITETTYATYIRDSKRTREARFLKAVHKAVERGGKVLIPVFALGRAQELLILIETYWERMGLDVPVYFSAGLTEKANMYYKLFINWTNEKIKSTFVKRNMFDFKHVQAFDRSYIERPGPMVLFATPGMLHAGTSLEVFKKWCTSEINLCILPGYCVVGTVGNLLLSGKKENIKIDKTYVDVKCNIQSLSFSAHADSKGILQLVEQCDPANIVLVHGEKGKMKILKRRIKKEYKKPCFAPANGVAVNIITNHDIPGDLSLNLLKRQFYDDKYEIDENNAPPQKKKRTVSSVPVSAVVVMHEDQNLQIFDPGEASSALQLTNHQIKFRSVYQLPDLINPDELFEDLVNLLKDAYLDNFHQDQDFKIQISDITIHIENGTFVIVWEESNEELADEINEKINQFIQEITKFLFPDNEMDID